MDLSELTERYPPLFHPAEADSARAISAHGLLPAQEIVSTSALDPDEHAAVLSRPRPATLSIEHEDSPFAEGLHRRTPQAAVVEPAVSGGVRDIADHTVDVYQVQAPARPAADTRYRSATARLSAREPETA